MVKLKILLISIIAVLTITLKAQSNHSGITVPFTLKKAGYVTLVIDDKSGKRVRNLVAETWFKAGDNTIMWDGLDDLGRDVEAATHGVYSIPSKQVVPGEYTVRGIVHPEITTSYEMSVYAPGTPPWTTNDHLGGWLGNHSAPQAAVFVPAEESPTHQPVVYLGCYVTEGPDGMAWVDLDGKKMGGREWVGGVWTAAPFMARDAGESSVPGVSIYIASVWKTKEKVPQVILRMNALPKNADKPLFVYPMRALVSNTENITGEIGGFAIHNGVGVASMPKLNQLVFADIKTGKLLGLSTVADPHGLTFDHQGRLLVLSGNKLLRFKSIEDVAHLAGPEVLIKAGLESPVGITTDGNGKLYISNGGSSHQVKIFSEEGKYLSAIGHAGIPKAGTYDPLHMNNPAGLTIDSRNQLWVAENDYLPKRVSVWSLDGKLIRAFYGPAKYGGGGTLDPQDKTRFYYAQEDLGSMEFKIDWKTGESRLTNILYRKMPESMVLAARNAGPETPVYYKGKRYFTNCYNSSPTSGNAVAFLFVERNGSYYPAAAMGRADSWDLLHKQGKNAQAFFIWNDQNEDAQVQDNELQFQQGETSGITVMPDLSFCITQLKGTSFQYFPLRFTAGGIPVYQIDKGKVLANGVQPPGSSGGNQVLVANNGWTVVTQGILPFDRFSLSGAKDGKPVWSYPDLWPGLHAAHSAPLPSFSGELIGPTRLLGGVLTINGNQFWAINSNHGMVYLFTTDGMFISTLFEPMRSGKPWNMPVATRGMSLKGVSLAEENFWPTITGTTAGEVYLVDGGRSSVVKVDGLQNIERLPPSTVKVSTEDLKLSLDLLAKAESLRQQNAGTTTLKVAILSTPVVVDGKWDDWKNVVWADIDKRGVKANFNSNSRPFNVTAAVAVSKDKLYLGYHTGDAALLRNSGEMPVAPFKTGGALDLMLSTASSADGGHKIPVAGDMRLLITLIKGKPLALLYSAVVPGTKEGDKIPFSSPWRTITFDRVDDITAQIEFAAGIDGSYEISVPLEVLHLIPKEGLSLRGDIGILRGDGAHTLSRMYWNNKATSIVSDVPSEAELTPALWGIWKFQSQ